MTTHTTFIYVRTSSESKLTGFGSEPEMTTPNSDHSLSVVSNGASPPVPNNSNNPPTDLPRKSNERTISGVFTYTSATDAETGAQEQRLEQLRSLKNISSNSLASLSSSNINGSILPPNGGLKGATAAMNGTIRPRSHSKAGSTHSMGTLTETIQEHTTSAINHPRNPKSFEGSATASAGDGINEYGIYPRREETSDSKRQKPQLHRGQSESAAKLQNDAVPASAGPVPDPSRLDPSAHQTASRHHGSVHRFSSPPAMTHVPTQGQDTTPRSSFSPEAPRLVQRHTLTVPRAGASGTRTSRDFSFSVGDEGAMTTGRFSPMRDSMDPATPRHRRPSLGLVRRTTRSMASDIHMDEVPPDEDAARWTEVIKQKRASRRRRREEEDDDRVIVGKKVEEGHVNWVTAYNMLTGIRFTVSRTNAKIDRELTDADFDARHKFSFDVTGNELTPSAKYDFKFKDYAPWVFRHLRGIFGLDPADYLISLTSKYILSELGSPGKSGSFFYFSRDYKYIIKTIHHAEHKLLRKILRDYYSHVRDNPNTLISQFYGLHRVKIPYGRKIHFVVMNNLFPPHRDIHTTFDLKGSTVGRDFKEDDLENNPRATLKDLNWLRRDLHLEFQHQVKKMFLDQIQKDVALLQRLHIMDYSLLVGMHDMNKGNEEKLRETTLKVFQPGGEQDLEDEKGAPLLRTPSRLENARKARELRQTLKKQKPTPMSLVAAKMPDEMKSTDARQYRIFYGDDGGIRATHEDGTGGDMVYYLGIIDCLTHYGFVKRIEHFWKGLSNARTQISPVPPQNYGDRFINFITGITMTQEEAERRKTLEGNENRESVDTHSVMNSHHLPEPIRTSIDISHARSSSDIDSASPRSPTAVDRTMRRAQKQVEKVAQDKDQPSEDSLPDRELRTVSIPSQDSNDRNQDGEKAGRNSTTLPVVQEVGEGSSDISSRRSDRGGSESRGTEPTITTNSTSKSTHNGRQVSSSTTGKESSEDLERDSRNDNRAQLSTPNTDYFTPTSPNFSRPNPHSPLLHPVQSQQQQPQPQSQSYEPKQNRDKPPRLGSGLIPNLGPLYSSPEGMDPEESVLGMDSSVIDGLALDGVHNTRENGYEDKPRRNPQ